MFKSKVLVIIAVLVLALAVVAMSCAPAAKPAPAAPPAATPPAAAPPAATPPSAPPAPPGGPTAPAAPKLSFESVTYTDDANGFSYMYPKSWVKIDLTGPMVSAVAASSTQGADSVSANVVPQAADFSVAMKAMYDENPGLKSLGVKVDIVSSKAVTLADGKTAASEAVCTAKVMGMYDLWAYGIGINKGGKTIAVTGWTLGGQAKKDLVTEISKTLAVK